MNEQELFWKNTYGEEYISKNQTFIMTKVLRHGKKYYQNVKKIT